ncbi:MAG: helix-turn-helix transcriptional regulator [Abitibacteriaceae bacterium]|nr:helix-turn-helix transcriptional regulator [Abditibacteriaceae bacterium]
MIQRLKEKRLAAGLTMREVGQRIGKTHTYVQKWESGDRQINPIDLRDVCLALGVSFVDFLKEIDEALMEQERAARSGESHRQPF